MGRYAGEYYEVQVPCWGGSHGPWAMNGNCHKCRHDRDSLVNSAIALLAKECPSVLTDEAKKAATR